MCRCLIHCAFRNPAISGSFASALLFIGTCFEGSAALMSPLAHAGCRTQYTHVGVQRHCQPACASSSADVRHHRRCSAGVTLRQSRLGEPIRSGPTEARPARGERHNSAAGRDRMAMCSSGLVRVRLLLLHRAKGTSCQSRRCPPATTTPPDLVDRTH
jgi:hypothetical protein